MLGSAYKRVRLLMLGNSQCCYSMSYSVNLMHPDKTELCHCADFTETGPFTGKLTRPWFSQISTGSLQLHIILSGL